MLNNKKMVLIPLLAFYFSDAYAMQMLDESKMADITGQDGITIALTNTDISIDRIILTDHDGLQPIAGQNFGIATPQTGAIVLGNGNRDIRMTGGQSKIVIDTDGGNNAPVLNINISMPDDLEVTTGDMYVASKDANGELQNQVKVLDSMNIKLSGLSINIQLGNAPQGDMMKIYGHINNGIRISNFGLLSDGTQYAFGAGEFAVTDQGSNDLTINGAGVGVVSNGLLITPSPGKMVDVSMKDFTFGGLPSSGSASSVGEMFISGLAVGNNTLRISGH